MTSEGEGLRLLEQIRELSNEILSSLTDVDNRLERMQDILESGDLFDRREILEEIKGMRITLGSIEKEDQQEMQDETILEGMMKKLDNLIQLAIGCETQKRQEQKEEKS